MRKIFKEIKETFWFWGPMFLFIIIVSSYMYYKSHYCKEIPCTRIGTRCVKSHIEENGYGGRYHREWEVCDEEETFYYESTYDSCGCNKIK